MADHADSLPGIFLQAHPVKEAYKGGKCALEPGRVRKYDHAVVSVKKCGLMPDLPSRSPPCFRVFHDSVHPVPDDPLSPTIFNVVVDAVVRHWVNGVIEEAEARGEMGR